MKKMRIIALILCLALLASLTACGVKTKDQAQAPAETTEAAAATEAATEAAAAETAAEAAPAASGKTAADVGTIRLVYASSDEVTANVLRDQLVKAGFNVELTAFADSSARKEQIKNGSFDIAILSWANPVGTPDYGIRGIWHSKGDSNWTGISDPKVDELIELAATQTSDVFVGTYAEVEKYVVAEQCYEYPLYQDKRATGLNNAFDPACITTNMRWDYFRYVDQSNNATRPLTIAQTGSSFFTMDCIRADDATCGVLLDHAYIHLVTLLPDWSCGVEESLSYAFAINDTNDGYYFLLRDDCHFARVDKDKNVYDSGVMVSGEDVVYSLNRAKDPNSTALHATFSMYELVDSVEIFTDMAELENTKTASGKSIRETLEANGNTIGELVATKDLVNNADGKYQVIKLKTKAPYPQILNALAFHGGGIVDAEWVEAHNEGIDFANYDASKDRLYGDTKYIEDTAEYDNDLSVSGNYVPVVKDDYQFVAKRNPYIRMNEDYSQCVDTVITKFIADKDAILNGMRSGEVDYTTSLPTTKLSLVEQDPNLTLIMAAGIRDYYLAFNMHGNADVSKSANLRLAIASAMDFDALNAVNSGNLDVATSPLTACLKTGNEFKFQAGDTQKYLDAYFAEQQ